MLPSPTRLAEVVSTFKKATSCRSCGRSPSSSSSKRRVEKNDGIGDSDTSSSTHYYDGALLVSPSCGHFFCRDCWEKAAADASTQSAGNDDRQQMVHCPVCQCSSDLAPRPIIPSLMRGVAGPKCMGHDDYSEQGELGMENSSEVPERPESSAVVNEDCIEQLGALLGMLRQLRGKSSHTRAKEDHAKVEEVGNGDMGKSADDGLPKNQTMDWDASDEDSEHETEIPGTCLPSTENKIEIRPMSGIDDDVGETYQQTSEMLDMEQPSPQHETASIGMEAEAETPTVRESQLSSIRLSSIKSDAKKGDNENNLSQVLGETEVPCTYLSPLRQSPSERKFQLTIYNSQSPPIGKSPAQLSCKLEEDETEVPGTLLSPLRKNLDDRKFELKLCDSKSPEKDMSSDPILGEALEENETEVPGTFLSPLRKNLEERRYRLNSESPENEKSSNSMGDALEEDETEVPCTLLSPFHKNLKGRDNANTASTVEPSFQQPEILEKGTATTCAAYYGDGNDRLKPEQHPSGSPVKQTETEVPGMLLPPLAKHPSTVHTSIHSQDGDIDAVNKREQSKEGEDESLIGPRRVSTSPVKLKQKEIPSKNNKDQSSPVLPKKRPLENDEHDRAQTSKELIMEDIRPWNIHSEPIMSQLTCDVKTGPICKPPPQKTPVQTRPSTATKNGYGKQKLYVAFDILDQVEMNALKFCHEQGFGTVVLDGVRSARKGCGHAETVPFPAILITHAIDKPGLGSQKQSSIATCYRSYSYLKAKSLGAQIVDARWMVDSQNAGILLDCNMYKIRTDLESYQSLTEEELIDNVARRESSMIHVFDGMTFGLLQDRSSSTELINCKSQSVSSLLRAETKPIMTEEIESLVQCWGGRVTTDELKHMDLLLVDSCMTLDLIAKDLQHKFKNNCNIRRWSIEKWKNEELDGFIVDGALTSDYGDGIHAKIPIVQTKWLEDSICLNTLQSLKSYCWGMLCL